MNTEIYDSVGLEREEVASFMRRVYEQGLTTSSGGNLSRRVGDNLVLVTPAASDKGATSAEKIAVVDMDGNNLTPWIRPTIEVPMHLAIYRTRPDVNAVTHAHCLFATTFACIGEEVAVDMTPETIMVVGSIARAEYHPAGTREMGEATAAALANANAALMDHHGLTTVGKTMWNAYDRLEVVEMCAKMNWLARSMGKSPSLTPEQKQVVLRLMQK